MSVGRYYLSTLFATILLTLMVYELDRAYPGGLDKREQSAQRILKGGRAPDLPPWAGVYHVPGAHSDDIVLHLNPAGFLLGNGLPRWFRDDHGVPSPEGPLGSVKELPNGTLRLQEMGVTPFNGSVPGRTHIMYLITWDTRVYAVTSRQMPRFIREVNAGLSPDGWRQDARLPYRIVGQESLGYMATKLSKTPPALPPEYRDSLLSKPLVSAVTQVGSTSYRTRQWMKERITRVTVSAGRAHGLRPGMSLYARNNDGPNEITLDQIGETSSEGYYIAPEYRRPLELPGSPYEGQRTTSYSEWGAAPEPR